MCLIWGTTYLVIKHSLHDLSPPAGVGVRFILAGLLFALIGLIVRAPRARAPLGLTVTLATGLFGVNYVLVYTAETHLASGMMAVLFAIFPFCMYGFGALLLGERITTRALAGTVVAVLGVVLISSSVLGSAPAPYVLAALAAPVTAAYANVRLKQSGVTSPLSVYPQAMLLAGTVSLAVGVATSKIDYAAALSASSLWDLAYLTVFGTCVAFTLNMWVLRHLSAGTVGLSQLVVPTVAVLVGAAFGHESLSPLELGGAALVILGLAVAIVAPGSRRVQAYAASVRVATPADRCA